LKPWRSFGTSRADFCILFGCVATKDSGCDSDIADNEDEVMSSDPVPSAAIYDATTGGRSVIIVTGGSTGDVLTLQADGTYIAATPAGGSLSGTGAVDNAVCGPMALAGQRCKTQRLSSPTTQRHRLTTP
jgi:hypothetical protein